MARSRALRRNAATRLAPSALEVAERVRAAVARAPVHLVDGAGEVLVKASIGVATLPGLAANAQDLIAAADAALYEAKRTGKHRVCVASETGGRRATGAGRKPARRRDLHPHGERRASDRAVAVSRRARMVPRAE